QHLYCTSLGDCLHLSSFIPGNHSLAHCTSSTTRPVAQVLILL
uniref:Uncharacterized protein n=1 Tax=Aegilops tauschii subsp. strangulata TaxID=200361 RepID=A0A453AFH8_AEGTS